MKYVFIFAHPDDETVACAGTIKRLVDQGDSVSLITATLGDAGEVMEPAIKKLEKFGSLELLRRQELQAACTHLGISELIELGYQDGEITNKIVWEGLKHSLVTQIDRLQPDIVVTFDHTGWYYHLDHVGVSIASTLAFHHSKHRPQALLHSHFQPGGEKWNYIFHKPPATHKVLIEDTQHKLDAMDLHQSQNLDIPKQFVKNQHPHHELYELAFATDEGTDLIKRSDIFDEM